MIDVNEQLLAALAQAARDAGAEILAIVERGFDIERKDDSSPVTEADKAAEKIILAALAEHAPGIPVIAEEQHAAGCVPDHGDTFFLVDPLDGTKEFIRGGEDYTVNIGLIRAGEPVLGVVFAPATQTLYEGIADVGAWRTRGRGSREEIRVRDRAGAISAVASKSHRSPETDKYLADIGAEDFVSVGSSLKLCLVAEGRADIYPRLGPTCEWDVAAGHAVLAAAGGKVDGMDGHRLRYDKPAFFNRGFVATAGWQAPAIAPYMGEVQDR